MGSSIDKEEFSQADYTLFAERLQQSLVVLQDLLSRPGFGDGPKTLGAEMELSIVDQEGCAYPINRSVLAGNLDASFQLELNRFNLEYNTSPVSLAGTPFSQMESELTQALHTLNQLAGTQGGRVVPIGILPTLTEADLQATALTDHPRYRALSAALRTLRHQPFQVCIDGPDPLKMTWDDVTLEGANTSFQVHLRVPPSEFAAVYNAAQLVSPVAVPCVRILLCFWATACGMKREWRCSSSPLILGCLPMVTGACRRGCPMDWGGCAKGPMNFLPKPSGFFPRCCPSRARTRHWNVINGEPCLRWMSYGCIKAPSGDGIVPCMIPNTAVTCALNCDRYLRGPTPLDMAANTAFLVGMIQAFSSEVDRLLPVFPLSIRIAIFTGGSIWPRRGPCCGPSPGTLHHGKYPSVTWPWTCCRWPSKDCRN